MFYPLKNPVNVETFFCVALQTQNCEFIFANSFFFEFGAAQSPTCMIYIILYYNILRHIFISFQKTLTSTTQFSTDFVL